MWSIGEVKQAGWQKIKMYYWPALLVTLITSLLSGSSGGSSGARIGYNQNNGYNGSMPSGDVGVIGSGLSEAALIFASVTIGLMIAIFLFLFLLKIFVGNPVEVGKDRYFMESRGLERSAGIGKVFWAFSSGHYLNIVKIMFLRDVYTFLWSLLLVIPGIIKSYEYAMIPYILSENPEAETADVFALTKEMMDDNKLSFFCFELSFIGWYLLGILACCIGMIFVTPYFEAAQAEIYARLRGRIDGFPFRGFGISEETDGFERVYENGDQY